MADSEQTKNSPRMDLFVGLLSRSYPGASVSRVAERVVAVHCGDADADSLYNSLPPFSTESSGWVLVLVDTPHRGDERCDRFSTESKGSPDDQLALEALAERILDIVTDPDRTGLEGLVILYSEGDSSKFDFLCDALRASLAHPLAV